MSTKFENVPVEDDTNIISQEVIDFDGYSVLHQKWSWEGVSAESLIFSNDDISSITIEDLETKIRKSPMLMSESSVTVKESDAGFTFFNFNFDM